MEELEQLYEAYRRGEESPLPELEVQYGEYALEQRERLNEEKLQQQTEYWKTQLDGMPQVLELPSRPCAAGKAEFPRRNASAKPGERAVGRPECSGKKRRGQSIHDIAGCVPGAADEVHRAGGFWTWHSNSQP